MDDGWSGTASAALTHLLLPIHWIYTNLVLTLSWLLTPVVLLGRIAFSIFMLPVHVFAQLETFVIFFGVAVGVGLLLGVCLHFLGRGIVNLLELNRPTPSSIGGSGSTSSTSSSTKAAAGHTAATYRAAQAKKRLEEAQRRAAQSQILAAAPLLGVTGKGRNGRAAKTSYPSPTSPRQRGGLMGTTILEEVDDSDEDYGF